MTRKIFITTSMVGFHCWLDAPDTHAYLRAVHRHRFGVRVEVKVSHANRDIEFHDLKSKVGACCGAIARSLLQQQHEAELSCEMIAEKLYQALLEDFVIRASSITVDEDGECGATIEFDEVETKQLEGEVHD